MIGAPMTSAAIAAPIAIRGHHIPIQRERGSESSFSRHARNFVMQSGTHWVRHLWIGAKLCATRLRGRFEKFFDWFLWARVA